MSERASKCGGRSSNNSETGMTTKQLFLNVTIKIKSKKNRGKQHIISDFVLFKSTNQFQQRGSVIPDQCDDAISLSTDRF
jgi:hypothetical protein